MAKQIAAPLTPAPEVPEPSNGLPAAAVRWLGRRTVAAMRDDGDCLVIVSYPDYQKAAFRK